MYIMNYCYQLSQLLDQQESIVYTDEILQKQNTRAVLSFLSYYSFLATMHKLKMN